MESKLNTVWPDNSLLDVHPGKNISTLYAGNDNIVKPKEIISYNNDTPFTFSSFYPGGTNTFKFNKSQQFVKNISVVFELEYVNKEGLFINEDYLAYNMIKNISYQIGLTERFTINTESFMHIIMNDAENQEKKDKLLDLAGSIIGSESDTKGLQSGRRRYLAMLPLPFSSVTSVNANKRQCYPLPLYYQDIPLEIIITLRNKDECFSIPAGGDVKYIRGTLYYEYGKVAENNQLKYSIYKYPFINNFSHQYTVDHTNKEVEIQLKSFRRAELRGISFHYVPNALSQHIYSGRKISDLLLTYNGKKIWQSEINELYEIVYGTACNNLGRRKIISTANANNFLHTTQITDENLDHYNSTNLTTINGLFIVSRNELLIDSEPKIGGPFSDKYYYYIPISEIKDFSQSYTLGADFGKDEITLKFKRPDTVKGGKIYCTYHYSSIYEFEKNKCRLIM
jgi:hypothetical protein